MQIHGRLLKAAAALVAIALALASPPVATSATARPFDECDPEYLECKAYNWVLIHICSQYAWPPLGYEWCPNTQGDIPYSHNEECQITSASAECVPVLEDLCGELWCG